MEHNLVSRRSSRQEKISNAMKEKAATPEARRSSKIIEEEDVNPFSQPYIDWHNGLKHQIDDEHAAQLNSSGSCQKQQLRFKTMSEDELVKHMSNLPAYLQQVEKQKNVQDKALNFGVLDWKRLEKWKYNERMPVRGHWKVSSSGNFSSMPTVTPGQSKTSLQRKQVSADLHPKSSVEVRLPNCVQQSQVKFKCVQDSQTTSLSTASGQQNDFCQKVKFSSQSRSEPNKNKSKRVEADQKSTTDKVVSCSKQSKRTSSLSSVQMTDHYGRRKTTIDDGTNLCLKYPADEPEHIVLLVPKLPPKRSSSQNTLGESTTSCDGELAEDNRKRFSDSFSSQELHLGEFNNEIPHSCPLPASVSISQGMQSDACTFPHENHPPITPRPSNVKCQETRNSNGDCSVSVQTSNQMDFDTAEPSAVNGRHSSPNRRFSFSLSRLSRSFSFKETTVPKLSSTYVAAKSGLVSSEVLASIDETKIDKARASGRGRSSPFRRLLNPILKPKVAHSAQPVQPLEKDLHFATSESPIKANIPVLDEMHQTSTFQALLQFIINNGLPFFKFVVGNSSDILVAALRNLPTSEKTDCSLIFKFYSVHEIKKKTGSWIGHGSKDKSCSFGYNIVGHMEISCLSGTVKEAVLHNVDIGQGGDKGSPEVLPGREIAAIMVRDPAAKVNCKEKKEDSECKGKGYVRCSPGDICNGVENENFDGTLVILPGGIHSLPNKGAPSSLIDRWKSGGLCDCGGWDIGCKLRVLTDQNQESNSTDCFVPGHIDLFNQGGGGRSQPSFSLAPIKDGFFSVEFNASIPLLEAFSICVAVITNQKLPDILDMNLLPEAKVSADAMTETEKLKNLNTILGQVPAKYVRSPPSSPVGRI